ncbi:lysostaphin resistance A-like protein [uncultured Psychrobacter sp.]|uniref:CPBP family intramembrane glutamic endopeptidase n=1 Tax=uncultured Psychrobacter sp. TaxID=259303 RepID=UPI003458D8C9
MSNHASSVNHLSAPPQRPALFSPLGTFLLVVGMVIVFFMSQLLGMYIAGRLWLPAGNQLSIGNLFFLGSSDGTVVSASIIISCALITALILLVVHLKGGRVKEYLALAPFSWKVFVGMFGLLLLFMVGSQALTYWLAKSPSLFVDPLYDSVSSVWLLVLAMVIVAPIYEELVFRGILWSAIAEQFSSSSALGKSGAIIASLVTSLIFATIHLQYGLYEISTIVILALIFCYARVKSGSLLLPIVLHIINNGIAMGQYLLYGA